MLSHLFGFPSKRKLVIFTSLLFPTRVDGFVLPSTALERISLKWHADFAFNNVFVSPTRRPFHALSQNSNDSFGTKTSSSGVDSWESDDDSSTEFDADYLSDFGDDDNQIEKNDGDSTSDDPLFLEYQQWKEALEKCASGLDKKQRSLHSELEKAESMEDTVQRAELITSNMYLFTPGVRTATVNDWNRDGVEVELTLDKAYDSASAEADALFQQVRKLKRGSQIILPLLDEIEEGKEILSEIEADFSAAFSPDGTVNENVLRLVQDRLLRTCKTTGFREPMDSDHSTTENKKGPVRNQRQDKPALGTPASNVRKFTSPGGCVVFVGRNRRGNEYLTFNIARGEDIWMHARGCPGAHVLIQQRRGSPPATEACLQFGADLAIFYSDARSETSFDVTTTEPKHLLKPRGAPLGAVKLRQESGTLVGRPDSVPEECKQARDASGQETEYRFQNKAKHRRRTTEAAKKQRDKRRANKK
uniref:NFACT RNA-binding domain-containing protein n=1 Tax=Amphora coffeiformis TaxID=265554 RepID=A0A7S3L6I0_9STRA|eukprot:scaffold15695_cov160-Amphora_coffeaeformis.AAC.1